MVDYDFRFGGTLANDPHNSEVFYGGGGAGILQYTNMSVCKTTDCGRTWSHMYVADSGIAFSLVVDPINPDIVYAGGKPGIYKSTNGGGGWTRLPNGITGTVYAIAVHPTITNILYAGTPLGVFRSSNGGERWVNTGLVNVKAIVVDLSSPDKIFAGTANGVYASTSGGGNWVAMNQGLADSNVTCLGIHPNAYLFAGTGGGGVYRWPLITRVGDQSPSHSRLTFRAMPTPARNRVVIAYYVPFRDKVSLEVYDAQGRLVKNLVSQVKESGGYAESWQCFDNNDRRVPAGVYFCQFSTGRSTLVKKLILLE